MKLGKAFSDNVIVEKTNSQRLFTSLQAPWWFGAGRALLFAIVLVVALFVLASRLFHLTVIQGHTFRVLADGNRTRELVRHAPRGIFLDRTGKPLVENLPHYRLLAPCEKNPEQICTTTITEEQGNKLRQEGLPQGTFLEVYYVRTYLYPESTSHVLGYTGEIRAKELSDEYYVLRKYKSGDTVGRMGAEAVFEEQLRGRNGRELVEVDAQGRTLRVLGQDPEIAGEDIMLSLDAELSEVAKNAFPSGRRGTVLVTKPQTGEILVLYSSPSFSNNAFSFGMTQEEYDELINDPAQPMFNRAIGGVYPPGSTYKIVTSLAALEEKAVTGQTLIEDTGVITIGPFTFPNWYFLKYGKTDGMVDLVKALARSNDIYYYKVGEALGISKLNAWSARVGIGKPLGIELGGEAGGLIPSPEWKNTRFSTEADKIARNNEWYLGDTYHVSIGQGYLLTTPLQVAVWTDLIANGGSVCRPTIQKVGPHHPAECTDLKLQQNTIPNIIQGMEAACSTGGTGWPLFNFRVPVKTEEEKEIASPSAGLAAQKFRSVPVACKTGTAEFGDPQDKTHAWFTAFGPIRDPNDALHDYAGSEVVSGDPEISVTVLVEAAGEGSDVAAPVAKKILEAWFSR